MITLPHLSLWLDLVLSSYTCNVNSLDRVWFRFPGYFLFWCLSLSWNSCKTASYISSASDNQVGQVENRKWPRWQSHREPLGAVTSPHLMMTNVSILTAHSSQTNTNTIPRPLSLLINTTGLSVSRPDLGPEQTCTTLWLRPDSHLTEHLKKKKCHSHCAPEPSPSIMFHLWAWLDQSGPRRLPSLCLIDPLSPSFIPFACLWHMCQRQHSRLMDRPVYGCQSAW